nr:uncharacterized protein LOC105466405 [Macaca nemestrina]
MGALHWLEGSPNAFHLEGSLQATSRARHSDPLIDEGTECGPGPDLQLGTLDSEFGWGSCPGQGLSLSNHLGLALALGLPCRCCGKDVLRLLGLHFLVSKLEQPRHDETCTGRAPGDDVTLLLPGNRPRRPWGQSESLGTSPPPRAGRPGAPRCLLPPRGRPAVLHPRGAPESRWVPGLAEVRGGLPASPLPGSWGGEGQRPVNGALPALCKAAATDNWGFPPGPPCSPAK